MFYVQYIIWAEASVGGQILIDNEPSGFGWCCNAGEDKMKESISLVDIIKEVIGQIE